MEEITIEIDESEPPWCFGMADFRNHQCTRCNINNECLATIDELTDGKESKEAP